METRAERTKLDLGLSRGLGPLRRCPPARHRTLALENREQRLWRVDPALASNSLRPSSFGGGGGAAVDKNHRFYAFPRLRHFARQAFPVRQGFDERGAQADLPLVALGLANPGF